MEVMDLYLGLIIDTFIQVLKDRQDIQATNFKTHDFSFKIIVEKLPGYSMKALACHQITMPT